jgi:DNA invertase Pin-like site-specific DNA recombinase
MTTATILRQSKQMTFENLKGLRAAAYIRDSTLDQRDGFGPDIQRHNEERFAETYGLILENRWYTEFVSGRSAKKRHQFQQFLEDARLDLFDVLLVDHTSRFGRNQAECIRYKEELQRLGKVVVFVSQGIISGSDHDFVSERVNETLDELYSRNLSGYVSEAMAEKAQHGLANGPVSFGYKSEFVGKRRREQKVPDSETMPVLIQLLRDYASSQYSYREVADRLNASGYRTNKGNLFTGYFIRDVLSNQFYEGKVVYHKGLPDEQVIDGFHDVPSEVRELWLRCQEVKRERVIQTAGHPRNEKHEYPFSRLLKCQRCGNPYHGEAVYSRNGANLRLIHERRGLGRKCDSRPRSRSVESLCQEFSDRVLAHVHLDDGWKNMIVAAMRAEPELKDLQGQRNRLTRALENLRKQHLWGDISDDEYRQERTALERQLKIVSHDPVPAHLPNLERLAQLLNDLPELWSHPAVTNGQREALIQEVFRKVTIDGTSLISIEPKPVYVPLFATMCMQKSYGYCETDSPPSPRPMID